MCNDLGLKHNALQSGRQPPEPATLRSKTRMCLPFFVARLSIINSCVNFAMAGLSHDLYFVVPGAIWSADGPSASTGICRILEALRMIVLLSKCLQWLAEQESLHKSARTFLGRCPRPGFFRKHRICWFLPPLCGFTLYASISGRGGEKRSAAARRPVRRNRR
jgi:hypothetical protein